jgi:hypothetical protein
MGAIMSTKRAREEESAVLPLTRKRAREEESVVRAKVRETLPEVKQYNSGKVWFEKFETRSYCVGSMTDTTLSIKNYWVLYLYTLVDDGTHRLMQVCHSIEYKVINIGLFDYPKFEDLPENIEEPVGEGQMPS